VTVDRRSFPVVIVAREGDRVELEIAGERVVVDRWPEAEASPRAPVVVDGEGSEVRVERGAGDAAAPRPIAAVPGAPGGGMGGTPAEGAPVVPPMPGRVVELRVREGDRVKKGDVLLVLEAMKMRSEVASPADGVVRGIRVAAGANARAREPMLFVARD
jgi:glutaconyl-CoA/methylmalonyl-CoA decarboxylase subunit gamma